jgi:mRNA interferase MazF
MLTRDEVIHRRNEIIVAPVTRTIRGLQTGVLLTEEDGMPAARAVNFDHLSLGQRDRFWSVLCTLSEQRWPEARRALLTPCGFDQE